MPEEAKSALRAFGLLIIGLSAVTLLATLVGQFVR